MQHSGLAQPSCLPRWDVWWLLLLISFAFLPNKGPSSHFSRQPHTAGKDAGDQMTGCGSGT